jgi:septal ring factor EnvC (AmiA/AmiB activator)
MALTDFGTLSLSCETTTNKMIKAADTYKKHIEEDVAPAVENGFGNFSNAISKAKDETKELNSETKKFIKTLQSQDTALQKSTEQLNAYKTDIDNVKNSQSLTAKALKQAQAKLAEQEKQTRY